MENTVLSLGGIKMLDPAGISFTKENGGYLSLTYENTEYKKIKLKRALPYNSPDEFICLADKEDKEIGIIRRLSDLPEAQQTLVREELSRLYYCPEIIKILSAKDRMGYMYFEAVTKVGKCEFAVRDASRNIRFIDPAASRPAVQISDVDGNRYIIPDYSSFDSASAKKIDAFLV